jgi:hypothetical protein
LATSDPISVIRRQARESLRAIQETQRFAGHPVPDIYVPEDAPYEMHYPCRELNWPGPEVVQTSHDAAPSPDSFEEIQRLVADGLGEQHFRDLNNANNQAPGAKHMMVSHISNLDHAVSLLGTAPSADADLLELLNTPYPFARYLALRELGRDPAANHELLLAQLDRSAKASDPVGFHWTCEALAGGQIDSALPALARYATPEPVKNLHGPIGMGYGYPAAKAIGRITGQVDHPEVQRLLAEQNVWLVAGVLAGLTEARSPGIEELLVRSSDPRQPAIIRNEAAVRLRRLKEK